MNKNKQKFNQLLEEYRKLELALQDISPFYNIPGFAELKKRIKYFENRDCANEH